MLLDKTLTVKPISEENTNVIYFLLYHFLHAKLYIISVTKEKN